MKIVVSNILVFIGLCLALETGYRFAFEGKSDINPSLWQKFHPYIMFRAAENLSGDWAWFDQFRNRQIQAKYPTNKLGFPLPLDLKIGEQVNKKEGEKSVILLGGSAAWGVGATSYETSIQGRLETYLNSGQERFQYRVYNLAMGGHLSFQQLIILNLYGPILQPDWVITMDGTNDAAIVCAHAQGAGYPLYYSLMNQYVEGYTFGQKSPPLFRSRIENELLKISVAYRNITGQSPILLPKFFENPTGDPNAPSAKHIGMDGVTWEDLEDQLLFYENAQRQMRVSFPYSNFIFSTQPVVHDFDQMYGEGSYSNDPVKRTKARTKKMKELENLSIEYSNLELGEGYWPICRDYFHPMSAFNLETVAMRLSEKIVASTKYINMGKFFASNEEVRRDFFIDVVHLNDKGLDILASEYAKQILSTDLD